MKKSLKIAAANLGAVIALAATLALPTFLAGCRAVTVENYGEEIARDADDKPVTLADGRIQTIKKGWRVHHNQHWMNTKADSIEAHIKPEDISFAMNGLNTQPSEELNKMVGTSLDGLTKLVVACADAYTKIAGGGAQADTALAAGKKVLEYFSSQGGDLSKATVTTTANNKLQVTDGATSVECDAAGNCENCTAK
ncbi:MAG: hypothetical protein IIZ06_02020 [Kiritimatiellae bacterium]|nr:hypothetical protein [Kiritimatiellia bacterium]